MAVQIRKATRRKVKIKMGFNGPAGSGKTMSALYTAYGLCGDWEKVLVIDAENRSSELYSHLGPFSVIELRPPFTPEKFIEAIKAAESAGMEVIVVDSASAEWSGKGGVLEIHGSMAGNSFTNWGKVTPRHNAFVECMLFCECHVICTLRTKTDYVLVEKNGKQVPEKVGMKAETRDSMDYELTLVFDMDAKNFANASKDRTSIFFNKPAFIPTEQTGKLILDWCNSGIEPISLPPAPEASQQPAKALTAPPKTELPTMSPEDLTQLKEEAGKCGNEETLKNLFISKKEKFKIVKGDAAMIIYSDRVKQLTENLTKVN